MSILTSILLFLSFPPFNWWYFAFFAFVPLFLVISNKKSYIRVIYGLISGFIFYAFSLYWIKNVAGFIYLLIPLYLCFYWGIFVFLVFSFDDKKIIFLGSCIWFFIEILIANLLTGFPWLALGLSQYKNIKLLKIAKFTGIYGISFLVIGTNFFLYTLFKRKFLYQKIFFLLFLIFLFLLTEFPEKMSFKGKLRILIYQPNFVPSEITLEENKKKIIYFFEKNLNEENKKEDIDIVILPEGAFQENLFENIDLLNKLKEISQKNKCGIVIGCFTRKNGNFYNSSIFINGNRLELYNKIHLVPYGEFILGERFKFIKDIFLKVAGYYPNLKKGDEYKIFEYKGIKFSTLICYENIFSELVINFLEKGSDFFIVITNDSWFGKSTGPYQHFSHNIFRAIETGRYFLQAGLTGITGIVNPEGKIEKFFEKNGEKLFVEGFLLYELPVFIYNTFYSKYGVYPFFIFCLILTGFIVCRK
ncbi:MAG: apolipoprotein N-acyltransferase [Candidatus Omnitrophica bacterium]|nr:apolipoprotein N-acyltransferase [Candidatus Omnitrophota bacterium]